MSKPLGGSVIPRPRDATTISFVADSDNWCRLVFLYNPTINELIKRLGGQHYYYSRDTKNWYVQRGEVSRLFAAQLEAQGYTVLYDIADAQRNTELQKTLRVLAETRDSLVEMTKAWGEERERAVSLAIDVKALRSEVNALKRSLLWEHLSKQVSSPTEAWQLLFGSLPLRLRAPLFRAASKALHPDTGGDNSAMAALNSAYDKTGRS